MSRPAKWSAALSRTFRARRMQRFVRTLRITSDTRVLDVGGTYDIWRLAPIQPRLTFLNHPRARNEMDVSIQTVFGDGSALPFADQSFDVVFSNSVIEHVGDPKSQAQFAREIERVGRSYWVQTPARSFPIETHLSTPFVHLLPKRMQAAVVKRFTVWELIARPDPAQREWYLDHFLTSIRLLNPAELRTLFPGARILKERWLGLAKSLIAVGPGIFPVR